MAAESATNSIALKREKLAAELALNPDTYETTNKVALTTGGYFDISTVDPVKEIGGYNDSLAELIGKRANTLIMGTKVWNRLKTHPLLKNYLIVPGTNQAPVVSSADLSKVLEIPKVIIAEAMYTEDKATFDFIWGNAILLAYVTPPSPLGRTPYQPCFGYTLRKNGYPVADAWWENNGKIRKVRSTDLFTNKVVGAESAFLINTPITPANY
jgi:hypothetical protein